MLLVPVFVLAGFMPDTFRTREAVAGSTFLFLLGAFGVVIRNWGHEDRRRPDGPGHGHQQRGS
jgi:hypothetical protein